MLHGLARSPRLEGGGELGVSVKRAKRVYIGAEGAEDVRDAVGEHGKDAFSPFLFRPVGSFH
jgi:hypothetical protein